MPLRRTKQGEYFSRRLRHPEHKRERKRSDTFLALSRGYHPRSFPPTPFLTTLAASSSPSPVAFFIYSRPWGLFSRLPLTSRLFLTLEPRAHRKAPVRTHARRHRPQLSFSDSPLALQPGFNDPGTARDADTCLAFSPYSPSKDRELSDKTALATPPQPFPPRVGTRARSSRMHNFGQYRQSSTQLSFRRSDPPTGYQTKPTTLSHATTPITEITVLVPAPHHTSQSVIHRPLAQTSVRSDSIATNRLPHRWPPLQ